MRNDDTYHPGVRPATPETSALPPDALLLAPRPPDPPYELMAPDTPPAAVPDADLALDSSTPGTRWLARAVWALCLFAAAALLVKFAFLVQEAMALPLVLRLLALSGIGVACVALLAAAFALLRLCRRLPDFPQLPPAALADPPSAKPRLVPYLRPFAPARAYLRRAPFGPPAADALPLLDRLLADSAYADSGGWLADFQRFANLQDAAADACIERRARWVALKTALSPWKAIDMAAVLYHALALTLDLAALYARRVDRPRALRLALRALFTVGVSGAAQNLGESLSEALSVVTHGIPLAKLLGARVSEGALNYLLFRRLGARLKSSFRPIAPR